MNTVIALLLVFGIGMAVQRGNTCTVVAIDDIVHRRSWARALSIVFTWFWVAGGLTLVWLIGGPRFDARTFPVTAWSVVGGLLLGLGAVVNGACTTGTIARIGSGEYSFGMTIVGFFTGCVASSHVFGRAATTHTSELPATTSLDHPVLALSGLAVVVALTARRLIAGPHESVRDFLHKAWDPRTAMLIVAALFVALVQVAGPWAYTDMLGSLAHGDTTNIAARLTFLVFLLGGAITAGRSLRGPKPIGPLSPRVPRCTIGGFVMGLGFSVAPGAFDGMTLLGQPLLLPFAWVVMVASYLSILTGIAYLRSRFGSRIASRRG